MKLNILPVDRYVTIHLVGIDQQNFGQETSEDGKHTRGDTIIAMDSSSFRGKGICKWKIIWISIGNIFVSIFEYNEKRI